MLTILAICLGTWLLVMRHTDLVSKDSTVYMEMAKKWSSQPMAVIRGYDYPPGYPAATSAMHGLLTALGFPDDMQVWETSGRMVSLVAGVAALAAIWRIAVACFGPAIAAMSTLLFGLGKRWSQLTCDVLSDPLALCFQLWATVVLLKTASLHRQRRWSSLAWAALAGVLAALGYLARPESLWVVVIACIIWLWQVAARRAKLGMAVASMLVMLGAAFLVMAPYMSAIGGLSQKRSVGHMLGQTSPTNPAAGKVSISPGASKEDTNGALSQAWNKFIKPVLAGAWELVSECMEAMHPILAVMGGVWVVGLLIWLAKPDGPMAALLPLPSREGKMLMLAAVVVVAPILVLLYFKTTYIDQRHVIFLAALLSPLAGAGVVLLANVGGRFFGTGMRRHAVIMIAVAILLGCAIGLVWHTMQVGRTDKSYLRQAGLHIATIAKADDVLVTSSPLTGYYSDIPYRSFHPERDALKDLKNALDTLKPPATLLCVSRKEMNEAVAHDRRLKRYYQALPLTLITEFPQASKNGNDDDAMILFRIQSPSPASGPTHR